MSRTTGAAAASLVAIVVLSAGCASESRPQHPPAASPAPAQSASPPPVSPPPLPQAAGYKGALPPLPVSPFAPVRPQPVVQAVYEFAARHPEVLRYVPCFCGCERSGHGDNEDCFVAGREPDGRPRWDTHGMAWGICIDVARDAMQMHNSGAAIGNIRAAIDGKYRASFQTTTPTPFPPK